MGVTMERHVLMRLLAGDDEASAAALAVLQGGATYVVWDRTVPAERHARVYARRLRHVRLKGIEPLGLERPVELLRQHGRPVRGGMIESADRTCTPALPHRRRQRTGGLRQRAAGGRGITALGASWVTIGVTWGLLH